MPKKNILAGHRRIRIPIGERSFRNGRPYSGWKLQCDCGFSLDGLKNKRELEKAYAQHVKDALPICKLCNETKAFGSMSISNTTICKKCNTTLIKERHKKYPLHAKELKWKSHLKKKYNLTVEDYNNILAQQDYSCDVCKNKFTNNRGSRSHLDHCHSTGKARGILCFTCNQALGLFKDNIETLKNAVIYLVKHSTL